MKRIGLYLSLVVLTIAIALTTQLVRAQEVATSTKSETIDQLKIAQALIDTTTAARDELRVKIKQADQDQIPELQLELETLNNELNRQRDVFEQIAIGAVDVAILGEVDTAFDWRQEVSEIMAPIVANLKALTDKPRKINQLQTLIEQNRMQTGVINSAINSIDSNIAIADDPEIQEPLINLQKEWLSKKTENQQRLQFAQSQLAEIQNPDFNWRETLSDTVSNFAKGRGLTLLFAAIAAVIVWWLMRGVLALSHLKTKGSNKREYRTRTRVAQYAFRALTFILILIAVISVFYIRGDLLLMGLSILAAVGIVLGLRQAVPRFMTEAKLLLNLGSIREDERVIVNGLPWQVVSLNMHSVLRNPELTGVLRLPLSEINGLVSRPAGKESWFPAGKGDFIVLDDNSLFEVVRLTPETIELKDRGGTITTVPTTDFYSWTFKNLSRGDCFGISVTFGIDYQHQSISLTTVPERFKNAVQAALIQTDQAASIKEVLVEFQSAGDSSLDYWVYVTVDKKAAKAYKKFNRLIQQTLVTVCTEENWSIPFPHMTIQKMPDA